MDSVLDINIEQMTGSAPVTVVRLNGHVDAANAPEVEAAATGAIKDGARNVLLDMTAVSFMSSAGFRSIHKIYQALNPAGGSGNLKMLNPTQEIARLVKTLGFDNFVTVLSGDVQQAVESF